MTETTKKRTATKVAKRTVITELARIQSALKAPKGQVNRFGGYSFRSAEDILEAVKPLLEDCVLILDDEIKMIGERFYVQATAKIYFEDELQTATAYARETLEKKGMDLAQITGSASSYARKYALNGLFAIDNSELDPDAVAAREGEKEIAKGAPVKMQANVTVTTPAPKPVPKAGSMQAEFSTPANTKPATKVAAKPAAKPAPKAAKSPIEEVVEATPAVGKVEVKTQEQAKSIVADAVNELSTGDELFTRLTNMINSATTKEGMAEVAKTVGENKPKFNDAQIQQLSTAYKTRYAAILSGKI